MLNHSYLNLYFWEMCYNNYRLLCHIMLASQWKGIPCYSEHEVRIYYKPQVQNWARLAHLLYYFPSACLLFSFASMFTIERMLNRIIWGVCVYWKCRNDLIIGKMSLKFLLHIASKQHLVCLLPYALHYLEAAAVLWCSLYIICEVLWDEKRYINVQYYYGVLCFTGEATSGRLFYWVIS